MKMSENFLKTVFVQTETEIQNRIIGDIFYINKCKISKERLLYDVFGKMDRIFSYFYNEKVRLKRIKNIERKKELSEIFHLLDFKKVDKIFFELENMELFKEANFITIDGVNLLRRTKAKYLHCKRFFRKI